MFDDDGSWFNGSRKMTKATSGRFDLRRQVRTKLDALQYQRFGGSALAIPLSVHVSRLKGGLALSAHLRYYILCV